ncbi:hypothetical protein [Halorussus amylolyticus]|uniref:hypothetical protein n=1 Tax=Halorussus amylolyticus TaxID=1126242 RepID=UPI00104823B7|nr:hypothetical protein [Halorussus amylolyticus]
MSRLPNRPTALLLAGLLVGSLLAAAPAAGDGVGSHGGESEQRLIPTMTTNETPVEVEVDCNRSRVELAASEDFRYEVTVTVANITPSSNDVSRSTLGSVSGNETVALDGEGIVFVFAKDSTDGGGVVATAVTDCSVATEQSASDEGTTATESDDDPGIRIDCNESEVAYTAPEETEYVAKTVSVNVSPTGTSASSATRTLAGNETVSVDEGTLVAAFASTGDLGDDRTVSVIRNCSPYGDERLSENASDTDDRSGGLDA